MFLVRRAVALLVALALLAVPAVFNCACPARLPRAGLHPHPGLPTRLIPDALAAVAALGQAHGFDVDNTEDPAVFNDATLPAYSAVVFLLTTGDVLDDTAASRVRALHRGRRRVRRRPLGGRHRVRLAVVRRPGRRLLRRPPGTGPAAVAWRTATHPHGRTCRDWLRTDEWYNFRSNPRARRCTCWRASTSRPTRAGRWATTRSPGATPTTAAAPGTRRWATPSESYGEPEFLAHLLGGIEYAAAGNAPNTVD